MVPPSLKSNFKLMCWPSRRDNTDTLCPGRSAASIRSGSGLSEIEVFACRVYLYINILQNLIQSRAVMHSYFPIKNISIGDSTIFRQVELRTFHSRQSVNLQGVFMYIAFQEFCAQGVALLCPAFTSKQEFNNFQLSFCVSVHVLETVKKPPLDYKIIQYE